MSPRKTRSETYWYIISFLCVLFVLVEKIL